MYNIFLKFQNIKAIVRITIYFMVTVSLIAPFLRYAVASSKSSIDDLLLSAPPKNSIKFNFGDTIKTVEYCPDNTCDAIEAPAYVSNDRIKYISAAYLFFYSDYIYLKEWKMRDDVIKKLYLESKKHTNKSEGYDVSKMKCEFLRMLKKDNIKIFFIRHDEGSVSREDFTHEVLSKTFCK